MNVFQLQIYSGDRHAHVCILKGETLKMSAVILFLTFASFSTPVLSGIGCHYWDPNWLQHDPYTYDPCLEGNHHLITDPTRSVDYYDPAAPLIYDDYDYFYTVSPMEKNGWYRSIIPGAEDIALTRPEYGQCQTDHHWYLDVQNHYFLHDYGDDYYEIEYTHSDHGCCNGYTCMKHCNGFNVYQLGGNEYWHPWWVWDDGRICFGGDGECPQEDETCNKLFKKRNSPKITYRSTEKKVRSGVCKEEVEFQCLMERWVEGIKAVKLRFTWSIGNKTLLEEEKNGPDQTSTLSMEDIKEAGNTKANFQLECTVQWTTDSEPNFGSPATTSYDIGIKISTNTIRLTEGQDPDNVQLTSSIPIGCEYKCAQRDTHLCTAEMQVRYPVNGNNEISFLFGDNFENVGECGTSLTVSGNYHIGNIFNVPITIYPKDDGKYDSTQKVDVEFELLMSNDLWSGLTFNVEVLVHDINSGHGRQRSCSFYNDPHAGNFDSRWFEVQLAGFFTLFRHTHLPIDIEGYFQNYGGYTGVCGVAIRSGGDLYVIRYCRQPIIAKYYQCDSSSSSLIVDRQGDLYKIYLPTGMMVEFREGSMDIYPSVSDRGRSEGICGNYNEDSSDDFGIKDTNRTDSNKYAPNEFSNSWRVKESATLFQGKINDDGNRAFENKEFCECDQTGNIRCSPLPGLNKKLKGVGVIASGSCLNLKRSIVYSDYVSDKDEFVFNYDPDYIAPIPQWQNGWDESSAETFCQSYFFDNPLFNSCNELIETENVILSCVDDIHITGTTDYAKTQLDMIFAQCIEEVEKYEFVNTDSGEDYENPHEQLLESLCYSDCSGNGICVKGTCQCDGDYTGYDCSVDKNHIPKLLPFQWNSLCDKLSRPCQDTGVYADLLLDSENLKCLVQVLDTDYNIQSEPQIYNGELEHFQKVFCHIPDFKLPYIVSISVTNNNNNFSEPQPLLIYHSTCWQCNLDEGCQKKKSSCVIDEKCIANGELNPSNANEYCDPEQSESAWSSFPSVTSEHTPAISTGAIIGIAIAVVAVLIAVVTITIVVKKCSSKNAPRVASEIDLGKKQTAGAQSLEANQNGMPPTQTYVDLKALNPQVGIKPFNRLEPLHMNTEAKMRGSKDQVTNDPVMLNPMGLQREALPPVHGSAD